MNHSRNLFDIEGKVAVITGGAGVLGSEMAKGLLEAGAHVVILGLHEEKLHKMLALLGNGESGVTGLKCNVLDESSLSDAHSSIIDAFGRIDILINAAGGNMPAATIGIEQTIFDLPIDEFKKVTDLNLNGTVLPSLIFGKTMASQKCGSIINISSMASIKVISRVVGYAAAKAGMDNFTRWMAVEMALKFGDGIRVNAIAPGFILSEQNRTLLTNPDGSLTERGNAVIKMTPFKRFGTPDELIGTVLWLASDASKFVTGTIIPIDGGFSIYSGV